MCVSLCHRRKLLYFNHENCLPTQCPFTVPAGKCEDCRHRLGTLCGLTRAKLPDEGCCHFNVEPVTDESILAGAQEIALLGQRPGESVETTLDAYDVYFEVSGAGVAVSVDDLGIPDIYGQGTEPEVEAEIVGTSIDWTEFGLDW